MRVGVRVRVSVRVGVRVRVRVLVRLAATPAVAAPHQVQLLHALHSEA